MKLTKKQVEINTRILKACESLLGGFVTAIHDEAKGYAVKVLKTQEWRVLPFDLVNEVADLGCMNYCMIQN